MIAVELIMRIVYLRDKNEEHDCNKGLSRSNWLNYVVQQMLKRGG